MSKRRQLSLFVSGPEARALNELRGRVDPVQANLIDAHVTLCREDELASHPDRYIATRVGEWTGGTLPLKFGPPVPSKLHGVLLPCTDGQETFDELRRHILGCDAPSMNAHVTLAHPRNPVAAGNTPNAFKALRGGVALSLGHIALIEQTGSARWIKLWEEPLSFASRQKSAFC